MDKTLRISLVRSMIGRPEKHRRVLMGMGLTKIDKTVEYQDTPSIRGMIRKIAHLVVVQEKIK